MRPLLLTMQAFGPFTGTETIDFTRFGDNPMFLINGPTGAGKSTILDAICYALYGSTAGVEREAAQMRSDLSDDALSTEVELSFALGDKHWRVWRAPLQLRPKARGAGVTKSNPEARLWEVMDDGDEKLIVPKSPVEVTREIESLTGLNADQFRQVMVLPQGKFRELLMSPSADREKIFSTLFRTEIYKQIEDRLKSDAGDIRRRVDASRENMAGVLQSTGLESESALVEAIVALKVDLEMLQKKRESANKVMQGAIDNRRAAIMLAASLQKLRSGETQLKNLKANAAEIEQLKRRLRKADAAKPLILQKEQFQSAVEASLKLTQSITRLQEELGTFEEELAAAAVHRTQAKEASLASRPKTEHLSRLKTHQQKLEKLTPRITTVKTLEQECQGIQKKLEGISRALEEKRISAKECTDRVTRLKCQVDMLPATREKLLRLEHRLKTSTDLDGFIAQEKRYDREIKAGQKVIEQAGGALEQASQLAVKLEFQWHLSQAMLLSSKLEEGAPCPVCGSSEHPEPAHLDRSLDIVEKLQVEQARLEQSNAAEVLRKARERQHELLAGRSHTDQSIKQCKETLGDQQTAGTAALTQQFKATHTEVKSLEQHSQELVTVESHLATLGAIIDSQENEFRQVSVELQDSKERATIANTEVSQVLKDIPESLRTQAELSRAIKTTELEIQTLDQNLYSADQAFSRLSNLKIERAATLAGLREQLRVADEHVQVRSRQWEQALTSSEFSDEQDVLRSRQDISNYQKISREVEDYTRLLNETQAVVLHQRQELSGASAPDLPALEASETEATDAVSVLNRQWEQLNGRRVSLKSAAETLDKQAETAKSLEQEYAVLGRLSDVANGQSSTKISLQRFVLGVLLDDVLVDASRRLLLMSKHRYELIRREDKSKGNRASGLELDVRDAYNGTARPVSTLSGGESFMAALALALGLSDVVQAYAGGIRLDTLFIDEGFGSLDQESLDLAVKTLVDLQQTGRMIGVISHVSEMKEQISTRMDVVPGINGSNIQLLNIN